MNSDGALSSAAQNRRGRWNLLGACILLVGLSCAAWLWEWQNARRGQEDLSSLGLALSPDDSARYQRDVELYSGKLGALVDRWTRESAKLFHGKPLAETIAAIAVLGATGCFLAGWRIKPA